jgi:DNA polymerase III subunit chi
MTIIRFYELNSAKFQSDPLLLVAKLAEKAFEAQQSCVILAPDEQSAEQIDDKLWSYTEDAFVPHQIAGQDDDDDCPVLIVPPQFEAPERDITINLRNAEAPVRGVRLLEIIPHDENGKNLARARYKAFMQRGLQPTFEKV